MDDTQARLTHDAPARLASITLDAILRCRLYSKRRHLFGTRRMPFGRAYEHLWPFADAWSAVVTLASIAGQPRVRAVLDGFFDGLTSYHPLRSEVYRRTGAVSFEASIARRTDGTGEVFYDDNTWLGLALVRHHEVTGDARALGLAERLFEYIVSGWSTDDWSHPGGIRWKPSAAELSRNTCSNGPVAELAALLHQHTGRAATLAWARRIYDWTRATLLGPDGLYFDRISPAGGIEPTIWSYNQGTMVGAGVLLYEATGDRTYVQHASATAEASLERFNLDELVRQGAAFGAVFLRNLLLLDRVATNPAYRRLASAFGAAMWEKQRDPRTGFFGSGGPPLNSTAPMIEVYALLAGAEPHA